MVCMNGLPARGHASLGFPSASLRLCAALLLCGGAVPDAWAQPGGGGGGGGGGGSGGGTIYYVHVGIKTTWTMDPSADNQTQLGFGTYGPVSAEPHNGHRWFLDTRSSGDGQKTEVFALRDDYDFNTNNTSDTRVQLTGDLSIEVGGDGLYSLDWVASDQAVSFIGRRWSDTEVVEGGLYTAPLMFDGDGNLIGAGPSTLTVALPLKDTLWPNLRTYCWDPAGLRAAYEDTTGLWVADVLTGQHQRIVDGYLHTPRWSPDGAKIAFTTGDIWTVKPDGRGLKQIVRRTAEFSFDRPHWSPDGSSLVFYGGSRPGYLYNLDVFRATSAGKFLTNLTNTPNNGGAPSEFAEYTMGWR